MNFKLYLKIIFLTAALVGILNLIKNLNTNNSFNNPNSLTNVLLGAPETGIKAKVIIKQKNQKLENSEQLEQKANR